MYNTTKTPPPTTPWPEEHQDATTTTTKSNYFGARMRQAAKKLSVNVYKYPDSASDTCGTPSPQAGYRATNGKIYYVPNLC